jgi:hypothetical protein
METNFFDSLLDVLRAGIQQEEDGENEAVAAERLRSLLMDLNSRLNNQARLELLRSQFIVSCLNQASELIDSVSA